MEDILARMELQVREACEKAGHERIYVYYSAYDTNEEGEPTTSNLDEVAVEGKVALIGSADNFFGGEESMSYVSEILECPTWLQVAVCANAMIHWTLDDHHIFLEGINLVSTSSWGGGFGRSYSKELIKQIDTLVTQGVEVYEFSMGS